MSRGENRVVAVIPARYDSTRFPGKPLALIKGREMIVLVAENAAKCKTVDEIVVATDDDRILRAVEKAGFKAVMTGKDHASGTDRIAEAVKNNKADIVVNVQGDEPFIDPASVDKAVMALKKNSSLNVCTLAVPIKDAKTYNDPNAVKVVFDRSGNALYFSRSPIPYDRSPKKRGPEEMPQMPYKHLGLYVYRRKFLIKFQSMEQGTLERTEMLEQLRMLQNGVRIRVVIASRDSLGIDTPEDLKRARALFHV